MYASLCLKADGLRGCLSSLKKISGRRRHADDEDCLDFEDPFVADEAKLLCSKAYRVLGEKTQVATAPMNPLIRRRSTHVNEVVACSVVASEMLGLNTNLVRAIAIGHDIGHVPFGHQGEAFLAEVMDKKFCHEVMGPIVAQRIERKGAGLNLTWETLDGMMRHSGNTAQDGMTQEAWIVRYCDKFAYIFADYNDVIRRMRFPVPEELENAMNAFGQTQRERTTCAIAGLVVESCSCGRVCFENSELALKFKKLRDLMYGLYTRVTEQKPRRILEPILEYLTRQKIGYPFLLLALMTDKDVLHLSSLPMINAEHLQRTAIHEILPYLEGMGEIDMCNPDLGW